MTQYQAEQIPFPSPRRLQRELRLRKPPWWMVAGLALVIVGASVPLILIYQKRTSYSTLPKIHYVQDMDLQPGFRPQQSSSMFADGRATRQHLDGTMARGHLREDDHLYRGYRITQVGANETIEFYSTLPPSLLVNESRIQRGRDRYGIYCAVCHDELGTGNGVVHQRAAAAKEAKWVPPSNLLTQEFRDRLDGQIFQAIAEGVRNMPGYNTQINIEDRWAIVAYVRHLQSTQPVAIVEEPKAKE